MGDRRLSYPIVLQRPTQKEVENWKDKAEGKRNLYDGDELEKAKKSGISASAKTEFVETPFVPIRKTAPAVEIKPQMIRPLRDLVKGVKLILTTNVPEKMKLLRSVGLDPIMDLSKCYTKFNLIKFEDVKIREKIMHSCCRKVAFDKARDYERSVEPVVIIAMCSLVVFKEDLLGKPHEDMTNYRMLTMLNGEQHKVFTGVYFIKCGGVKPGTTKRAQVNRDMWRERYFETVTTVQLKEMSGRLIKEYIDLEEALFFPGGYNINGKGLSLVEWFEGDINNVKGLPLFNFCHELRKLLEGDWRDTVMRLTSYHGN